MSQHGASEEVGFGQDGPEDPPWEPTSTAPVVKLGAGSKAIPL